MAKPISNSTLKNSICSKEFTKLLAYVNTDCAMDADLPDTLTQIYVPTAEYTKSKKKFPENNFSRLYVSEWKVLKSDDNTPSLLYKLNFAYDAAELVDDISYEAFLKQYKDSAYKLREDLSITCSLLSVYCDRCLYAIQHEYKDIKTFYDKVDSAIKFALNDTRL